LCCEAVAVPWLSTATVDTSVPWLVSVVVSTARAAAETAAPWEAAGARWEAAGTPASDAVKLPICCQ
jgi:hypothetical protein